MTEFRGSSDDPTAQLQHALDRIVGMSDRDLSFYNIGYQLKDINTYGRIVEGVGAAAIRPVIRRVLLVRPPFLRDADYIQDNMADLAYSPRELEALNDAKRTSETRKASIEADVASGAEPWLSHVKHNERDVLNPLVVGFYQDDNGKMRTLYGPRYFLSKRQVENTIFGGRTELKEVNLLEGEFVQVEPTEVLKGTHWDVLPEDLRGHFERGEILVTTGHDLYAPTILDIDKLAKSDDPNGIFNLVCQKVREADGDGKYFLLYYSDYGGEDTGRTAVVMNIIDGELQPVVVTVGGKEFVVEVKGCGTKVGGFKGMHFRTGRDIVTGGAEVEQARTEFYRLEDDKRDGAPKAVGSVMFGNPNEQVFADSSFKTKKPYEQGYIIRLTPSTVRASFTGNEVYPDIVKPEFVNRILQIYTEQLVDHIFAEPPKILDRSSHTENILLWNNGEATFTDYSDHVAFADKAFPHYDNHGGDMTPKRMLEYYISMVEEIPGYGADGDRQKFYAGLQQSLAQHGIEVSLEDGDDVEQVTDKIWKAGMAYQVYKGRERGHYFPEGVFDEYWRTYTSDFSGRDLPRDSAEGLVAGEAKARADLLETIKFYKNRPNVVLPEGIDLDEWSSRIAEAKITELVPLSGKLLHLIYENDNYEKLPEGEREWVLNRSGFYGDFNFVMVHKLRDYFEHELDVVTSALLSCPEAERAELTAAQAEVQARSAMLTYLVDNDLAGYFESVSNPDGVRRMLSFGFYK